MKTKDLLILTLEEPSANEAGIYMIYSVLSERAYIGSSKNIRKRWSQHRSALRQNKHSNYHLQNSWNKYGEKFFIFHVLEICPENQLLKREGEFIRSVNKKLRFNLITKPHGSMTYRKKRNGRK